MDESNSNLLHYGFSSIDEEIAKDQRESEFASGSAALASSSSQDGVLENVNPSVILDITGAGEKKQQELLASQEEPSSVSAPEPPPADLASTTKAKPAPRSRKRKGGKVVRDENAPKQPQTGYVMFMNKRREDIKAKNANITFSELTKTIASEWSAMDLVEKKKYLDQAEEKKAKYVEELELYKQTAAFKSFQSKKQALAVAAKGAPSAEATGSTSKAGTTAAAPPRMPGMDLPIFTEEFLEHNKSREKELRELRKLNYQYEEQNAILSKHVEELKGIANSLDEEANTQRNNNIALIQHLESLRDTLTSSFVSIPLPGSKEVPTVATIDSYMTKLHKVILDSPQEHQDLIVAVREVVNKLNLEAYVT
ncbi:high mobility group protein 20A-like [Watersipora subatra]|uniref:high mobility group protein 20A-like n=1 Tax=Watersipora subatra TaxID=2589382 RepID=UPI00355C1618